MTDLELFKAFAAQANLPYKESSLAEYHPYQDLDPDGIVISFGREYDDNGGMPLITGYGGFVHEFTFNKDGKLIKSGTWE